MPRSMLVVPIVLLIATMGTTATVADMARNESELQNLEASDVKIVLNFPDARVDMVLETIARVGGFEVEFEGNDPDASVSIEWENVTILDALVQLADDFDLRYTVPAENRLIVAVVADDFEEE